MATRGAGARSGRALLGYVVMTAGFLAWVWAGLGLADGQSFRENLVPVLLGMSLLFNGAAGVLSARSCGS